MRLFLVRHGETVDNVAGVYAGFRDSPLTSHGVLQARRLGQHLVARQPPVGTIAHVFSSDLQRAANTAQALVDAQPLASRVSVTKLKDLRERNFGSSEGKQFGLKGQAGPASNPHKDAETYDQMGVRIRRFIDIHLAPILDTLDGHSSNSGERPVIIVAHGIILNVLLSALVAKYGSENLKANQGEDGRPEYWTAWSNTGYAEVLIDSRPGQDRSPASTLASSLETQNPEVTFDIVTLNETKHLDGLKKTRGGIGSAQFDKKQKTMDSFFGPAAKRQKTTGRGES